jgi:hypothetical protein
MIRRRDHYVVIETPWSAIAPVLRSGLVETIAWTPGTLATQPASNEEKWSRAGLGE